MGRQGMSDPLDDRRKVIVQVLRDCDRPVECGKLMEDAAVLIQDYERAYRISASTGAILLWALEGLLADITEYQTINNLGGENNHWQVIARKTIKEVKGELCSSK